MHWLLVLIRFHGSVIRTYLLTLTFQLHTPRTPRTWYFTALIVGVFGIPTPTVPICDASYHCLCSGYGFVHEFRSVLGEAWENDVGETSFGCPESWEDFEGKLAQEERCYFAGNLYHLMKMIGRIDALFFSFLLHLTWIITIPTPFQHRKLPQWSCRKKCVGAIYFRTWSALEKFCVEYLDTTWSLRAEITTRPHLDWI